MRKSEIKLGEVYQHTLQGKLWRVRVTALDKSMGESRPGQWGWTGELMPGQAEQGACWGFVSELDPDSNGLSGSALVDHVFDDDGETADD